jgi:hypothetical protein
MAIAFVVFEKCDRVLVVLKNAIAFCLCREVRCLTTSFTATCLVGLMGVQCTKLNMNKRLYNLYNFDNIDDIETKNLGKCPEKSDQESI